MLKIGDIEIYLINDCNYLVDPGGPFGLVPRALWSRWMKPTENHMVHMTQLCLLVKAWGKTVVVDTGQGEKLSEKFKSFAGMAGEGGLVRGLATLGIDPADVDLVINTHLHGDHCGGNTRFKPGSTTEVEPVFPNAEYVVQRREFEDAINPNERTRATYLAMNYQPLYENGQLTLLEGDTEFLPGITGIVTPGHTPGHMSVRFESQGQHAAFVCDLASYSIHFERLAWMTAYDVEPLITLETKRIWQQWALETQATLMFVHDPIRPVGRLAQSESGRLSIEPLPVPFVEV